MINRSWFYEKQKVELEKNNNSSGTKSVGANWAKLF